MEEKTKMDKILDNQEIINKKIDMLLKMMYDSQYTSNCQIFLQGLSLADIMNNSEKR